MSHVKSYALAIAWSTAETLVWMAPPHARWRWRVALLALGLLLAL